jgi:hypothetical protein
MSSYKGYTVEEARKLNTINGIKKVAKEMGISGYTTWKKKNGDIERGRNLIIREIEEERKEGEEMEQVEERRGDDMEAKEKIAKQVAEMTGESLDYFMSKDLDWLNKLQRDLEDADMRIQSNLDDEDLIDTRLDREVGIKNQAQMILDKVATDKPVMRKDKVIKSLVNKDIKGFEMALKEGGIPIDEIKKMVPIAQKLNNSINKQTLNDGSWLSKGMTALGAPELAVWQAGMKAIGLDMSPQRKKELQDLINGEYKGSTGNAITTLLEASVNPDAWGSMLTTTAKKRTDKVVNSFNDMIGKGDDIYEEGREKEKGVQQIIKDRKNTLKEQERKARELHKLKGGTDEDYSGPVYREDKNFEKNIGQVHLSEYGGKDDYSGWQKVGNFFKDLGIGLAEEFVDPFGMIEIVGGKPVKSDKLLDLEKQLKEKDPRKYAEYEKQVNKHIATLQKASVTDRNKEMISNHKPVAKQLGNIMRATLEENALLIKEGKEPLLSKDQVAEYVRYRDLLESGRISYHDLARITNRFGSDLPMDKLPQKLQDKYFQWQMEEESMLKSQGAGDSNLNIAGDVEAQEEMRNMEKAKRNKKEIEQRIKEQKIDDENREVIQSRADVISTGYVDTDNKNRAELRPRIVWGDTDAQLMPTEEQDRIDDLINSKMMMWKTLRTENNDTDNPLLQRQLQAEANRYKNTFPTPVDNGSKKVVKTNYKEKMGYETDNCNYDNVPVAFLKITDRKLIPVYAPKSESLPLLRKPEQVQAPFTEPQPNQDTSINQRVTELRMRNRFPERILQGYKGTTLNTPSTRFNPWMNMNYIR